MCGRKESTGMSQEGERMRLVSPLVSACNSGGPGSIPGLERSPGEGNGNRKESDMTEQLGFHFLSLCRILSALSRWQILYPHTLADCFISVTRLFSHLVMSDSLQLHGLWLARLLCPWNSPGKNPGVSCHFLCQGIFLTQGSNACLLHWQAGSLPLLSHQGSPITRQTFV